VRIRLKLYATLSDYLPTGAVANAVDVEVPDDASPHWVIDRYGVPRRLTHLVLVNGVYQDPDQREAPSLKDGDTLAIWPPIAGG
jgi:molybdopterin converting factor small subunit